MLTETEQKILRQVAWDSIHYGLKHQHALNTISLNDYPASLNAPCASFVSLHHKDDLRGCIGSLHAERALVDDVNYNANAAAFSDPRFAALQAPELNDISLQVSVLEPAKVMQFSSEQDLINQLVPTIDGLILTEGRHRATFLPVVWEQLPDAKMFLGQLKLKAGLASNYWSDSVEVSRYSTISF